MLTLTLACANLSSVDRLFDGFIFQIHFSAYEKVSWSTHAENLKTRWDTSGKFLVPMNRIAMLIQSVAHLLRYEKLLQNFQIYSDTACVHKARGQCEIFNLTAVISLRVQ